MRECDDASTIFWLCQYRFFGHIDSPTMNVFFAGPVAFVENAKSFLKDVYFV